jgi:FtsH-binding integral membrane protein
MNMEEITRWVYILFVAIAILAGLVVGYMAYSATGHWYDTGVADANGWVTLIMLVLGIIIGLTSITTKEVTPFLIATIALIVASIANVWSPLSNIHELLYYWATAILNFIVAFAAPAAVIIAIKSVFAMSKEK